jgi:hypothetical protein
VVGKAFYDWVDGKVEERNKKVISEANMGIEMDPEIAEIFKASTAVSGKYKHHSIVSSVPSNHIIMQWSRATATT